MNRNFEDELKSKKQEVEDLEGQLYGVDPDLKASLWYNPESPIYGLKQKKPVSDAQVLDLEHKRQEVENLEVKLQDIKVLETLIRDMNSELVTTNKVVEYSSLEYVSLKKQLSIREKECSELEDEIEDFKRLLVELKARIKRGEVKMQDLDKTLKGYQVKLFNKRSPY